MNEQIRLDLNTLRWAERQVCAYGYTSPSNYYGEVRKRVCQELQQVYHHYLNRQAEDPAATVELEPKDFLPDCDVKSIALDEPLSHDDVLKLTDKDGYITGVVRVELSEVLEANVDGFPDILSERLLETDLVEDLAYRAVGVEGNALLVEVYGHVENMEPEGEFLCIW